MKTRLLLALALSAPQLAASAEPPHSTLVVCAPGSPGTTEEAQGAMDAFANALAARAGLPQGSLGAIYAATEDAGVAKLREKSASLALVSLPFFLKHEKALALRARLEPVQQGGSETERWSLVAKKGRVANPAALDGFTLLSTAGFAPDFVRGTALGGFGKLPPTVKIVQSSAILSGLRRAAAGEPVALLLDGTQSAALPSLPLASDLEVVASSAPLPAGIFAAIDGRLSSARLSKLDSALKELPQDAVGGDALAGIRMSRFVPLDEKALSAARAAYQGAAR